MKKHVLMTLVLALCVILCSCTKKKKENNNLCAPQTVPVTVENTISTDREAMFLKYGPDYRFFESSILLKDFMDEEQCDGTVEMVTNIFQIATEDGGGYDVNVIMFSHSETLDTMEIKDGFWVEDFILEPVVITYRQAYERMMQSNYKIPHSRHCVLRKEVGPIDCNPQYIFGNTRAQIYVDAVTGDVSDTDPVFGRNVRIGCPLGEWP